MAQEERYQEWLERLEIPIEETATVARLTDYLFDTLGYSDLQIDAIVDAVDFRDIELADVGIHPFTIEFPWGKQIRYGIEGLPGAWGFTRMREIYERRKEEEVE